MIQLSFNEVTTPTAETEIYLEHGKDCSFICRRDVFYIDDMAALTVGLYGVTGKLVKLHVENNFVTFSALEQHFW